MKFFSRSGQFKDKMQIAIIGTGFWANYQVCAWRELKKNFCVDIVAIIDKDQQKAEAFAKKHNIEKYYSAIDELLNANPFLDMIDVITDLLRMKYLFTCFSHL